MKVLVVQSDRRHDPKRFRTGRSGSLCPLERDVAAEGLTKYPASTMESRLYRWDGYSQPAG